MRRRRKTCEDKRWRAFESRLRARAQVRDAPAHGWRTFESRLRKDGAGLIRAGQGTGEAAQGCLERGFECQLSATGATRAEHRKLGWLRRCPGPTTRRWLARAPRWMRGGCGPLCEGHRTCDTAARAVRWWRAGVRLA